MFIGCGCSYVTKVTELKEMMYYSCSENKAICSKDKIICTHLNLNNMSAVHFFETDLTWKQGKIGELSSPELDTKITCATPPEFPNGVPNIWSPEHLYAAAINSCYMATFLAIAENSRVLFDSFDCNTKIKLEMVDGKYLITEAEVSPVIVLNNSEKDKDRALRVVEKSKLHCLVTNSMKTKVEVNPIIK